MHHLHPGIIEAAPQCRREGFHVHPAVNVERPVRVHRNCGRYVLAFRTEGIRPEDIRVKIVKKDWLVVEGCSPGHALGCHIDEYSTKTKIRLGREIVECIDEHGIFYDVENGITRVAFTVAPREREDRDVHIHKVDFEEIRREAEVIA